MNPFGPANGGADVWAIASFYNPVGYRRRLENYRVFRARLTVPLVTVELALGRDFALGAGDADILVQLRGGDVMWQKERLLNVALAAVPAGCRKIAWVDADVIFARPDWAEDASRQLDRFAMAQLFSRARDLMPGRTASAPGAGEAIDARHSLAAAIARGGDPVASLSDLQAGIGRRYARGFAWAARRELLERHGFFDECVVGGGDSAIVGAAYGCFDYVVQRQHLNRPRAGRYLAWAEPFGAAVAGEVGVVGGDIFHLWHGSKAGRRTADRYQGLTRVGFDPASDLALADNGAWMWNSDNRALYDYVRGYFAARDEDGKTPLQHAMGRESSPEALALLRSHRAAE
jgi:hypothetical protein